MADKVVPFPQRGDRRHHQPGVGEPTATGERLRRGTEPPDDARAGLQFVYERTRTAIIPSGGKGRDALRFEYQTGPKFKVDDAGTIASRALFGWLHRADGRIGAMGFNEWHPWPGLAGDDFVWGMDECSQAAANLSVVLADAWEMDELSESGPVLEFSQVWMRPDHARGSVWAPVADALIRRRYEGRFSVLVLKAFPLEYEAAVPEGSPLERGFALRQRAAQRLFTRVLRVHPLPGDAGAEGWMWRPLRGDAPRPMQR